MASSNDLSKLNTFESIYQLAWAKFKKIWNWQLNWIQVDKKKMNSLDYNPFKMPIDTDIFLLREQEKFRKKQVLVLFGKL